MSDIVATQPQEQDVSEGVISKLKGSKGKDKQLLAKFEGYYSACQKNRMQFERVWWTNIAFYFGRHYVQWANNTSLSNMGRLTEPPAPPWRVRLVSNKIRPLIRGELAKMTQEKPQPFVIPASEDDKDRIAAKAAEAIFEYLSEETKLNKILRQSVFWALLCGSSFIKDYFDSTRPDSSGNIGSIVLERVSPFHIFVPDLSEEEMELQTYVIHAVMKPLDWVRYSYPKTGKNLKGDSGKSEAEFETKLQTAMGIKDQNSENKKVLVKEIWIKPNAEYPKGKFAIWAEDRFLVEPMDWPYDYVEYPFTKIDHIPTGRFYGDSTINDLIPLQKEYNRTRSQIIESKNRMSRPQLVAPKGSIKTSQITSEPGLIIEYQPGFDPPQPLPLQQLPSYVLQELDRIQMDMDDIAAQHEVSKGSAPPGVEAATAISFLQEQDDAKFMHTTSSVEEAVAQIGRHLLSHVVQFWQLPRQVKVLGTNGFTEAKMLQGSDLGNNVDLRVQPGSAAPRSRAAKQAFIMEVGKMGWAPPDQIFKYLGMAETDKMFEDLQVDARQAQRENIKMRMMAEEFAQQMQMVPQMPGMQQPQLQIPQFPPNLWDNHQMHVAEHNMFRKTEEFEMLSDEGKQIFNIHVMLHEQALMQQQGLQGPPGMVLPEQMRGRPGEGGEPPPGQPGPAPNSQRQVPVQ